MNKAQEGSATHTTHMPLMQIKLPKINIADPSNDHIVAHLGLAVEIFFNIKEAVRRECFTNALVALWVNTGK